ncbi:helix-turn-helix transcriptional regulator [Cytobacillus massiliigabonensis]|uniref:helix-turn-helix transcriptional regulator n=1 Tax=Cytobacillus massiliigabonensis TaxID=1871011 RepID=UPI000C838F0F|nr:helix-turn-helix transcriptional regulator [Cytobacillus massiliigabonensis]
MHIGKRIKYLRLKNDLTLEYLGKGVVSNTHLSNLEAGRYTPSDDILKLLSKKLDVEEDYFLLRNKYDDYLGKLITKFELSLLYNSNVNDIISEIEGREFILHIVQELQYFILKTCYLLKSGKIEEIQRYEKLIGIYLDGLEEDQLPDKIVKVYFYYLGLKAFNLCDLNTSYYYFKKLVSIHSDTVYIAPYKYNLALISKKKFNYFEAINFAKESLEVYIDEQSWEEMGNTYNFIGVIYWEQKNLVEALIYLKKAEKICEINNNKNLEARVFHNLGLVYKSQGEFKDADIYFNKSIEIKKSIKLNPLISYRALIDLHLKDNNINLATVELDNAKLFIKDDTDYYLIQALHSELLEHKEKLNESIVVLLECITFFEKQKDSYHLKRLYRRLGDKYFLYKKYKHAASYYKKHILLMEK